MSKWQKCYGKYVVNDPCYPFCSSPDGSGCDYSPIVDSGGSNPFGLTDQYTVTYGDDPVTGNYSRRTYTPVIDPYQTIVPPSNFNGMKEWDGLSDFSNEFVDAPLFMDDVSSTGFRDMDAMSSYNFQIVPTFDRSDFFEDDDAPTKYRWRVLG
tara:strand:+ start:622 stop:1080 length:459 start_codon:yes stop_codon:yes gene_type:complete